MKESATNLYESMEINEDKEKENLANSILTEVNTIASFMIQIWYKYAELIKISPKALCKILRESYKIKIKER